MVLVDRRLPNKIGILARLSRGQVCVDLGLRRRVFTHFLRHCKDDQFDRALTIRIIESLLIEIWVAHNHVLLQTALIEVCLVASVQTVNECQYLPWE
jgi:hypothetical protein